MENIAAEIAELLRDLSGALATLLADNLVGLYLYGSLTDDSFNPERSDIDCIAVTRHELSDQQFHGLDAWLIHAADTNPWVERLQISFLIRDEILVNTLKGNCLYQFGKLTRIGCDGNPIIWINVLQSGLTLFGPPAASFVPPITAATLFKALVREVGYLREEMIENPASEWRDVPKYRSYAVLTLCRILYSHTHGKVVSKPRAAEWALGTLPDEWHSIIEQARQADAGSRSTVVDLESIARFIEFAGAQLQAPTSRS